MRSRTYYVLMLFLVLYVICILECNGHINIKEEKRMPNVLHQIAFSRLSRRDIMKALADSLLRSRVRRGHRHMTDAGYGSRVQAASKLASALIAHNNLYGAYGPGKRKRTSAAEDNASMASTMFDTLADV